MDQIIQADILAKGGQKLRLTLSNGAVINGLSLGVITAVDDEGEELDYDVLVFQSFEPDAYYKLKNEDIKKVEKAS